MPAFSQLYSSALDAELGTDDSTTLFTTARRQAAINEGLQEFADLTECFLRQSTITCSNGVAEYNLLSTVNVPGGDFVRVASQGPEYHFTNNTGSTVTNYYAGPDFERRDIPWLNDYEPGWRQSTAGTPQYWYERWDGGRVLFGMYPPPEIDSSQSAKVVLPYVARLSTLTADTEVPFSIASTASGPSTGIRTDLDRYHQAAVHYAAYRLEKLRVNHQASQAQLQVFFGYVERFLRARRAKGGQTVKQARSYFAQARQRKQTQAGGPLDVNASRWIY